ncbi:MAG: UDP-N-acetylglucosamine 1-carboxyvinyltransferase [Proteobacteria bacterium]|nr:UDP-N-acetylglucosamine 1-carboxyvinyltransferase [Desulfobulbaceae bacterium]MBU4151425.1 UDP-N-acetylglucosamine 1-carboxyvinyltransferase [Pseudomonadota bacterium]MDP2105854.1 UDP-N-acetylglucosamine 1-carboxyvinyltransferase [Desulfobulbaceae bacterium]
MDKLVIEGGQPLYGEITISGAKNAALPLIAATLLAPGKHIVRNVPNLRDTKTIFKLLESFGAVTQLSIDGILTVNSDQITNLEASYDLVKTMRASVLVLGPLLARFGRARVSLPGGCAIGARPIDFHLQALQKMGVRLVLAEGYVDAVVDDSLQGAPIYFDIPSVTGTENILMAAVLAKGTTVIKNAAREPEVGNLIDMLRAMGADIEGKDTDRLTVNGVTRLKATDTYVIPDRIETGTYLIAVGAAGGEVTVKGCRPGHLPSLLDKLRSAGLTVEEGGDSIQVARHGALRSIDIKTMPFPGFPTDLQAQIMALMAMTEGGLSVIHETIFENRFMHVAELLRLGANIKVDGRSAIVKGTGGYTGAKVMATDLRASASLVIAGLAAKGITEISRIYHLERGYDNLAGKLQALGAKINQVRE